MPKFHQPRSLIRSCVRLQDDAKPDLFEADRHIFSIPNVPETSRPPSAATRPRRNFTTNAVPTAVSVTPALPGPAEASLPEQASSLIPPVAEFVSLLGVTGSIP